ncbi:MAG: YIP1 family protein [Xanthomonadales bacterium]|jgi:hypothetical protein|nr:YIP1 family protein [Xanthomonadales bacterium]
MSSNYTVFNAMVDIIASPARAIDEIRDHTSWLWAPLILLIVLTCAAFSYYYTWVDFDWLVEETIRGLPAESRAEAAPGVRGFMSPTTSIAITVASIVFVTMIMLSIFAGYVHLVAKLTTSAEIRYGQWFSLNAWTSFPGVINAVAMFIVILTASSNQLSQDALSPLSFNSLFIGAEPGDPWFNWGNSTNLIQIWSSALLGLGFSRWTGSSLVKGLIVAFAPLVLIYGIWAALV